MAAPASDDFREKTESARESIKGLLEEMRLQMHLASMEAKDAWQDLEPQLKHMESRLDEVSLQLKQTTGEAEVQAHLAAREAKDRWEALQESVSDVVESVRESVMDKSRAPKRVVDRSKVQAHLARLEAQDRIERAADEVRTKLKDSRNEVVHEATRFVDGLATALLSLKDRLDRHKKS